MGSQNTRRWMVAIFAAGLIVGTVATGAYFAANPVTETETRVEYQTIKQPVSDAGFVVQVTDGPTAPLNWGYPVAVEFQRADDGNWTTRYLTTVFRNERVVVDLNESTRYRVVVTPPNGDRRFLGTFIPKHTDGHVRLVVGPCCHDYPNDDG